MKTIIENGEELSVTDEQIEMLIERILIYECSVCGFYHATDRNTLNDIENVL